jgi:Flp pilus assembly protein TadG
MSPSSRQERGTIIVLLAVFLLVMLCFVALGTEAGRWYLVRAELSKGVDAGALAAAKNISNPHVDPPTLAREFCVENFPPGSFGTPGGGVGTVAFDARFADVDKVTVEGHATALSVMGQLLGVREVPVSSAGTAQKREAEIMMLLDRSGSMAGAPLSDLKRASKSFLDYFATTQDRDKVGLISFATSVSLDRALGTMFVTPMKTAIDAMGAVGATNAEDAVDRADGAGGFTDQSGVPGDRRLQQFVIFFSDGRPTAFHDRFLNRGVAYDAVGCVTGNCIPSEVGNQTVTYADLGRPDREQWLGIDPTTTGDGLLPAASRCGPARVSTRWYAFDTVPVTGYGPLDCAIPYRTTLASYVCNVAANRMLAHAQELKDERVTIFVIGLGAVNRPLLEQLASSPDLVYYAPTSDQLQALFQRVAQEIKLRLVQ